MTVILGFFIVTGCVFGGYVLHGGNMGVLNQPTEFLIIGGAAIGSLVISSSPALIKRIISMVLSTLKSKPLTKEDYLQLLMLLFEVCKSARQNLLGLESHVENPEGSDIFSRYPSVLANHHAIHFICDTLKVQIASPLSPYDLEDLMDKDIEAAHAEEGQVPETISTIGDALPGLGIVAAVLGVVITMGKLTMGKEVIGHSVAAALVGTFLGILLSYGYAQPISGKLKNMIAEEGKYIEVIKVALLAFVKDASPKVCVEFARRSIPPECRPSFNEVDEATANVGKAAA